jgi:hypothetical protein
MYLIAQAGAYFIYDLGNVPWLGKPCYSQLVQVVFRHLFLANNST